MKHFKKKLTSFVKKAKEIFKPTDIKPINRDWMNLSTNDILNKLRKGINKVARTVVEKTK